MSRQTCTKPGSVLTCCFFGTNSSSVAEPSKGSWDSSMGTEKVHAHSTKSVLKEQPPAVVVDKESFSLASTVEILPKTNQTGVQQQQPRPQPQPYANSSSAVVPQMAQQVANQMQPPTLESLLSEYSLTHLRSYDRMLGEYRVIRKLSSGTCAVVLLGMHALTARKVAIKRQEKKGRNIRQIAREADIQLCLQHPNIAELLEISDGPSEVIIVQEFCGGGELFDAVTPEVGCALNVARSYIIQLCRALEYIHGMGIAHRDIKPENVMLTPDKRMIKLIDFGLSERIQPPGYRYKRRVGTVPYMDPDLWTTGTAKEDQYVELNLEAVDVWAAGVVLFCMLCGRFPWAEATSRSLEYRRYCANDFSFFPWTRLGDVHLTLLRAMLSLDPTKRFSAAQARQFAETCWPTLTSSQHREKVRLELKMGSGSQGSIGVDALMHMGSSSATIGSPAKPPRTATPAAVQSPMVTGGAGVGGGVTGAANQASRFNFDIRSEAVVA